MRLYEALCCFMCAFSKLLARAFLWELFCGSFIDFIDSNKKASLARFLRDFVLKSLNFKFPSKR